VLVFLLLLFFRMKYLMNSEHFSDRIFTQKISRFIFSDRNTISDEIVELNSVWNLILVS
jgi:hypothetical protein